MSRQDFHLSGVEYGCEEGECSAIQNPANLRRQVEGCITVGLGGAGETPIIAIAPAVANAVHHAIGRRLRGMPLEAELKKA